MTGPANRIGDVVAGRFRLERLLGAGGMGEVYIAIQEPLGRRVALKPIKAGLADDAAAAGRFVGEARSLVAVEQEIAELLTLVRDKGPGQACAVPPRICGDWIVSAGEACDDGNLIDGDGRDATCLPSGCGNGAVTGDEVCDDGNQINGDGCDDNCTLSACGNGVVAPGEQCDDGNSIDGDGCDRTCTPSSCGNGVRAGDEACDDGNLDNGDGCSARCRVEAPPSPLPALFGAGGGGAVLVGGVLAGVGSLPLLATTSAPPRPCRASTPRSAFATPPTPRPVRSPPAATGRPGGSQPSSPASPWAPSGS